MGLGDGRSRSVYDVCRHAGACQFRSHRSSYNRASSQQRPDQRTAGCFGRSFRSGSTRPVPSHISRREDPATMKASTAMYASVLFDRRGRIVAASCVPASGADDDRIAMPTPVPGAGQRIARIRFDLPSADIDAATFFAAHRVRRVGARTELVTAARRTVAKAAKKKRSRTARSKR